MIINPQIPLHRLVLSLSEALDHVSPSVADHQLRVAYISTRIARTMGYRGQKLRDVFHAAALHDIGLVRAENRMRAVACNKLESLGWHGEAGYELLADCDFFAEAAPVVRHHHAVWSHGAGRDGRGGPIPRASFIVALADTVDRSIDRNVPILHQSQAILERVSEGAGGLFPPETLEALRQCAESPAFWLDCTSKRIYTILSREVDWPTLTIDEAAVEGIARVFGRLVDSLSPWTGTHSAGVAATATALAARMNFSEREQLLMRAAGYLHDLGKVTVPTEILDKPGKPTKEQWAILKGHTYHTFQILDTIGGMPQISEWAAFHHERLDGRGYPFGHSRRELTLGARIMCVADVFTAVTEDRPYRPGMNDQQALAVLDDLGDNGGLDTNVIDTLKGDFDAINAIRLNEQAEYAVKQGHLSRVMDGDGSMTG